MIKNLLEDYRLRVLTARANGDTLRNSQGSWITPAQAHRELLRLGYTEVPDES
jgi:hypothetical protein